jgi:hypothetical protein
MKLQKSFPLSNRYNNILKKLNEKKSSPSSCSLLCVMKIIGVFLFLICAFCFVCWVSSENVPFETDNGMNAFI